MFYSPAILAKKGDLGKVWLASHWQHKLTKQQVFSTDVAQSVQAIMEPKYKLSLRLSGHLLHGVARIHQRKVAYLFSDCSEALVKIKMAFRPGVVNLSVPEAALGAASLINAPLAHADSDKDANNRFRNVDVELEADDWMKLTPLRGAGPSSSAPRGTLTGRRGFSMTPARGGMRIDDDARSVITMNEEEDKWSAFQPDAHPVVELSSIEFVREADKSASRLVAGASGLASGGGELPGVGVGADAGAGQVMDEPQFQDMDMGGEDIPYQPYEGDNNNNNENADAFGGANNASALLMRSWIDDEAEDKRGDENEDNKQQKARGQGATDEEGGAAAGKAKAGAKRKADRSRKARTKRLETVTELTSAEIQAGLVWAFRPFHRTAGTSGSGHFVKISSAGMSGVKSS